MNLVIGFCSVLFFNPCAVCAGVKCLSSSVYIYIYIYIYMCICVCVVKKHGCLRLTARKSPQKGSLLLDLQIYSPVKKSTKSGESTSNANPWLSI